MLDVAVVTPRMPAYLVLRQEHDLQQHEGRLLLQHGCQLVKVKASACGFLVEAIMPSCSNTTHSCYEVGDKGEGVTRRGSPSPAFLKYFKYCILAY